MILTITINPLLEKIYLFASVSFDKNNRNGKVRTAAGGKGINVSRQLIHLETDNHALTFAGGLNGKLFKEILAKETLKFSIVRTSSETRSAVVIVDESKKKFSTFFEENSIITNSEVEEFKSKLAKMIPTCEIIIFSGSSPCQAADSIFPYGIKLANEHDKISMCDTYGSHLAECINSAPTIIHNNISEIVESLGYNLRNEKEVEEFFDHAYKKGVKQVYITDGSHTAFASNFDFHYKIEPPEINLFSAVGSGDAFTAGITYGWHNNLNFQDTLKISTALGAVNASRFDVCNVTFDEIQKIKENIKISPIGKKINLIDVTPQ
jgi:tagatose 6-phosphate kinase